jgi:hypothetical protein
MRSEKVSTRTIDRLKDEVYRQMLRLEGGRPSAEVLLAVGLLHAWMALEGEPPGCETRQWLRRLSPVCVRMIEEACQTHGGGCVQEADEKLRAASLKSKKIF